MNYEDQGVCIDTAPFIYFIEKDSKYLSIVRPIFAEIDTGKIDALNINHHIIRGVSPPIQDEK